MHTLHRRRHRPLHTEDAPLVGIGFGGATPRRVHGFGGTAHEIWCTTRPADRPAIGWTHLPLRRSKRRRLLPRHNRAGFQAATSAARERLAQRVSYKVSGALIARCDASL